MTLALPSLVFEVGLTNGWADAAPTWVDLSSRVVSFSMTRGRADQTSAFDVGSASLVLDNSDRMLDPSNASGLVYGGDGAPMCPARVRHNYGGTTRTLFHGYLGEAWTPDWSANGEYQTCRVELVDRLGLLSLLGMPSSPFAAMVTLLAPSFWVRGLGGAATAGNGDALKDWSGNGWDATIAATGAQVLLPAEALVANEADGAVFVDGAGTMDFHGDHAGITGAQNDVTALFCWAGATVSGASKTLARQQSGANIEWDVICTTAGVIRARCYNAGVITEQIDAPANPASGGRWDDDLGHIIAVRVEGSGGGSRLRIWVDNFTASVAPITPASSQGTLFFGGSTQTMRYDECMWWPVAVSLTNLSYLYGSWNGSASVAPFAGESLQGRCSRIYQLVPALYASLDGFEGFDWHQGETTTPIDPTCKGFVSIPKSVGEAFQILAQSFGGVCWGTRGGRLRVRSRRALDETSTAPRNYPAAYRTTVAYLTDEVVPVSSPAVRRAALERSGLRADRITNECNVTLQMDANTSYVASYRDDASVARYGLRPVEYSTDIGDLAAASAIAKLTVERYKDPAQELRAVRLTPGLDATVAQFCFVDCELEKQVVVIESSFDGAHVRTDTVNIQGESWVWETGVSCTVDLFVAPS